MKIHPDLLNIFDPSHPERTYEEAIATAKEKAAATPPPTDPNKPDLNVFIDGRLPKVDPTTAIVEYVFQGKGWRDATLTAKERADEEKRRQEEASGLVEIPRPEW